jgi:hypothetical protein
VGKGNGHEPHGSELALLPHSCAPVAWMCRTKFVTGPGASEEAHPMSWSGGMVHRAVQLMLPAVASGIE